MKEYLKNKHAPLVIAAVGSCALFPLALLNFMPDRDAAMYYIPMAREIAHGNYAHGFYPSIPPLFSIISSMIVKITGASAFLSCKLVSMSFLILTTFPLYGFVNILWRDKGLAALSCILLFLCYSLVESGYSPLLDTGKTFFVTLIAFALARLHKSPNLFGIALISIGAAGVTLIRAEGIIIAAPALLMIPFLIRSGNMPINGMWAAVSIALYLLLISPWVAYQYTTTGYMVTDARQAQLIHSFLADETTKAIEWTFPGQLRETERIEAENTQQPDQPQQTRKEEQGSFYDRIGSQILKGFFLPYAILYIPLLFWKAIRNRILPFEVLIISAMITHALIVLLSLGGTWIQGRYLLPMLPLALGFTAESILLIYSKMSGHRKLAYAVLSIFVLFSVTKSIKNVPELYFSEKQQPKRSMREAASIIKNRELNNGNPRSGNVSSQIQYFNGSTPVILAGSAQIAALADADFVLSATNQFSFSRSTKAEILAYFSANKVGYLILDRRLPIGENISRLIETKKLQKIIELGDPPKNKVIIYTVEMHSG